MAPRSAPRRGRGSQYRYTFGVGAAPRNGALPNGCRGRPPRAWTACGTQRPAPECVAYGKNTEEDDTWDLPVILYWDMFWVA